MSHVKLLHSDGWLLASIIDASRSAPATLPGIIAAADYINHAIITRGELESGFSRLIAAGYITQSVDGFSVSEAVETFWQAKGSQRRYVLKAWEDVAGFIGAADYAPGALPDTVEESYVSSADYESALSCYLRSMGSAKNPDSK